MGVRRGASEEDKKSCLGPFTSEPGYELLYWIPYLRHRLRGDFSGQVAVTRGGAGIWYPCKTLDSYDVVSLDEYIDGLNYRARQRNSYKSEKDDPLDKTILERMKLQSDIHPSEFITPHVSKVIAESRSHPHERFEKPERFKELPDKYIAFRFYESLIFRKEHNADHWARHLLNEARKTAKTVLLRPNRSFDDHGEFADLEADITITYDHRMSLDTISRVVAHADQFVATYGGISYLGPLYGVPTVAVNDCVEHSMHFETEDRMVKACNGSYVRLSTKR